MPNRAAFCAPAPRLYLKLRVQGKKQLRSQRSGSIRVLFLPYPTCDIHPVPLFPSH